MALPRITVSINGEDACALVDTGSSRTVSSLNLVKKCGGLISGNSSRVTMVSGGNAVSMGEARLKIGVCKMRVEITCLVMYPMVADFDVVLGMDFINSLGGVSVRNRQVTFGDINIPIPSSIESICAVAVKEDMGTGCKIETMNKQFLIEEEDFKACFDGKDWTVSWKWKDLPPERVRMIGNYKVKPEIEPQFNAKIEEWIDNGWLEPYDGPIKSVLPLMAVEQPTKKKVRPVLDFRFLNEHIKCYTGDSDICEEKLRKWRKNDERAKLLDLKDAYLQLRMDKQFWAYQVVFFKGKSYCLTRLGFGLNCAPRIMTHVLRRILSLESDIQEGTDSYIDDIMVDETIVSSEKVKTHLKSYGLQSKPVEDISNARVLGLQLYESQNGLRWRRGNNISEKIENNNELTRREYFSICGKLVGHYPVCGWLRLACSYVKRLCQGETWGDKVGNIAMSYLYEIMEQVKLRDPVGGIWTVTQLNECEVWCDASSIATGVILLENGNIIEDASWLRKRDDKAHINIAELESAIKGLNLSLKWGFKRIDMYTDSATVFGWITSVLTNSHKPKIYGLSEMLVKRRLQLFSEMCESYDSNVKIHLVKSNENKADVLTRVKQTWLKSQSPDSIESSNLMTCTTISPTVEDIHRKHHFGTYKTLYCCQQYGLEPTLNEVMDVVKNCNECCSIDPNPVSWEHGTLEVQKVWRRLACDVTHYRNTKYLTIIDCGPSRFCIWRKLRDERANTIANEMHNIFAERSPPQEFLVDNSKSFKSSEVRAVCEKFGVQLIFRCVNRPAGNGIIERNHRTIKRAAARSSRDPIDMTYWYNILPRNKCNPESIPSELLDYKWRFPLMVTSHEESSECSLKVGDEVYVKPNNVKCTGQWDRGRVSKVNSRHNVEVDGVPYHINHIRKYNMKNNGDEGESDNELEIDLPI